MALNGDILGTQIQAAIDSLSDTDKQDRDKLFKAMGGAIVAHIQANGQISTVVTGTLPAGPVAAFGTGTIT